MNTSCKVLNKENIKGLSSLRAHCGTNLDLFNKFIDFVAESYSSTNFQPKQKFIDWYKEQYNVEPDFMNGNPDVLEKAIVDYYEDCVPSVKDTNTIDSIVINSISELYANPEDRDVCIDYAADSIASLNKALFITSRRTNPTSFLANYIDNQKGLAYDLIDSSDIDNDDKFVAKQKIRIAINTKEIVKALKEYNINFKINSNARSKRFFKLRLLQTLANELSKRISIATGQPSKDILTRLMPKKGQEAFELTRGEALTMLGDKNISNADLNYLSLFYELKTDTNGEFFDEIIDSPKLNGIDFYTPKSNDTQETDKRVDEEETQDDSNSTVINEDDNYGSIVAAFDYTGLTTDALDNIDKEIKAHLASIKKLNSNNLINGQPDYDRNNPLDVPVGIDVHKAYGFLYHQVSYTNKDTMIRSIRLIANTYPGMASFHTLANELEADEDLANLYWNTFAKIVITKTITRTSPDGNSFFISNTSCDVKTQLRNSFLNSIRHTSRNIVEGNRWLEKANYLLTRLKDNHYKQMLESDRGLEQKSKLINDICEIIRVYYPCITEDSIKSFMKFHKDSSGVSNYLNNAEILIQQIVDTISEASEALENFSESATRYNTLDRFNKTLDGLIDRIYHIRSNEGISREQITNDLAALSVEDAKTYIKKYIKSESLLKTYDLYSYKHADLSGIEVEDHTTPELRKLAIDFADLMLDYSVVDSDLNSVNAKRNQVSSVINSSFLTNLINILQNEALLKDFGNSRSISSQYNLSHIMYEHLGVTKQETTYGLFRKDANGKVTPTEYAQELLKIALFDGAHDSVSDKAILYYQMSRGDYLGTAFVNYFDSETNISENNPNLPSIDIAGYFMRIPADAKNNFVVSAPKYGINGLYTITNNEEIEAIINNSINRIKRATDDEQATVVNNTPIFIDDKQVLINLITNVKQHKVSTIRLPYSVFKNTKDGDVISVLLQYDEDESGEEEDTNNKFIIKGVVNNKKLVNVEFVGMTSKFGIDVKNILHDIIFNDIDRRGAKIGDRIVTVQRQYNTQHPLFAALKRALRQEVIDMATVIDNFFLTDENGVVLKHTKESAELAGAKVGSPIFKPNITNDGNSNPGCYQNYHYNDGVLIKEKNGTYELTGNVFTSSKFTIVDRSTGERINYGDDLLKKHLNFLYGGTSKTSIHPIKDGDKIIDVDLSSIDEEINSMISQYITDSVKDNIERLDNYTDTLSYVTDKPINFDTVGEFVVNYRLTYYGFDDIFEGNSKLYKSDQDSFKRSKEVQSSGNPYGIPNFADLFTRKYSEIDSILDTEVFRDWGVRQHNQYRAVTIRNTKMTGETIGTFKLDSKGNPIAFNKIGVLSQKLIDEFVSQGFSVKESEDKAFNIMSRYYNPKVNDAQSYITFDEFIRRIARRGQLFKYKPLIDKIKNGEDLLVSELDEFIQVQKNFQYDVHYDEDAKGFFSRQIKNSEFVLVPQLIRGTELELVAKLMEKRGIDQLNTEETSKAGKTNILEVFDKNTGLLKQDIIDEIENGTGISEFSDKVINHRAIQYYNYEFLFTQQETHQHVNDENKAGVQIMKKLVDNIDESNTELWPIKQKLINLFNGNIIQSAKDYFEKLGIKFNKDGSLNIVKGDDGKLTIEGLNLKKLYDIYREELQRRRDDKNLLDFATLEDSPIPGVEPQPKLPDFLTLTSKTLEQIAQNAINNNIVRQTLPGFHGPQVTSVGFTERTINEIGGGKVVRKYSDKLRFHPDGKDYIEVMVSPSFFGLERRKKDGTLKSKQELLDELKNAGVDTFIGYRIPTEAKYSVAVMKVVDLIDDAYGSTIVVPNDWVAQTGSDFDIDSIYGIMYNTFVDKEGIIKRIEEDKDTKQSRDNGILTCMLTIMQHHSTLEERLLTSTTEHISAAIEKVVPENIKDAKKHRSQYDILDQVENHEDAISGMELKAISVAWDGLISIANTVGFYLPKDTHIIVNGHELKQFGDDSEHNHRNYEGHLLTAYSAETSPYEFDAIKTGAIPNINKYTFGVFKFLSGIGVDYDTNLAFMTTPGITRLVKINDRYNSIYSPYSPDVIKKAIEEIAKELNIDVKNLSTDAILEEIEKTCNVIFYNNGDNGNIVLNFEDIERIVNERNEFNRKIDEIRTILKFEQIKVLADKLTNISMVLRGDKISAKKSIYETEDILETCVELANDNTFTTKDGKNIIDAIFPGLTKDNGRNIKELDVVGFMASDRSSESSYKTLYNFMRCATIPSIIINKRLFSTESPIFDRLITRVQHYNKNFRRLTPDAKQQLVKYAISEVYGNVFLERTYDCETSINNEIPQDFDRDSENARIHGYKLLSDPLVIADLKKPTADEIEEFKCLSPGEQVLFIQDNFIGDDIFKLLQVELKPSDKKGHRIRFNSTSNNIEIARRLFTEAFFNSNPLISIAAHNLFKYAFIVEGYSMRKDGVSNIVSGTRNICLQQYVDSLRKEFDKHFGPNGEALTSNLALDFARSNTNLLSIPIHYVQRDSKNKEELHKIGHIIAIPDNKFNDDIIEKYDIGDGRLVKLRFKKDDDFVLYLCSYVKKGEDGMFVLHPLNKLETFEHGEFSLNSNNWEYPSSVYFENIERELIETDGLFNVSKVEDIVSKEIALPYLKTAIKVISGNKSNRPFDINNPTEDLYGISRTIIDKVKETFNGDVTPKTRTYVITSKLDSYIRRQGIYYGEPQVVKINEGTNEEREVTVAVWKLPFSDRLKIARAVEKGKTITDEKNPYKDIINDIIENGNIKYIIDNIYMITPPITISKEDMEIYNESSELPAASIKEISIENTAYQSYETISRIAKLGNVSAGKIKSLWNEFGIEYNKESITNNIDIVLTKSAPMIRETVSTILSKIKYFYNDEVTGEWLSINDLRLAPILATNKDLEQEFLQTLNLVDSISSTNTAIVALNIDSHDSEIKHALNTIRSAIIELRDNRTVLEAKEMYAKEVLGKRSTNPLIKNDLIDIFSPHYSTNWLNGWFSDMLETSNPFAQVLLKKVTDDIYRKDLAAAKAKRKWLKDVADLYARAKAAGMDVKLSKFIDDSGVVIQKFNDKLFEDLNNLRENIKETHKAYRNAEGFVEKHNAYKEYLEAKLEYDKFLIDHIEQPLIKDYYIDRYNLDKNMLYGSITPQENKISGGFFGNPELLEHSDILVEYKILKDRQIELYNIKRKGLLDDIQEQELNKIDEQLAELARPPIDIFDYDEVTEPKKPLTDEETIKAKINNYFSKRALIHYINELDNINTKYFQYDPVFGFEEELERNKKIIEDRELRDKNGNLSKPMSELMQDEEYVRAKLWMAQYTIFVPDDETEVRKKKAFAALGSVSKREHLKSIIRSKKARDDKGTVNAMLFSEDEIREIKDEQQREQIYAEGSPLSDRILISFAKHGNVVYNNEFYLGMMSDGTVTEDWLSTAKRINELLTPYYNETLGGIDWRLMGNTIKSRSVLRELGELYRHIDEIKKKEGSSNGEAVKDFFDKNVDDTMNDEEVAEFKRQETIAKTIGEDFYTAWKHASILDNGKINTYLYHSLRPKESVADKFIDRKKTEALQTLDDIYVKDYTEYYYAKFREMKEKGSEAFNKWYDENHIYNYRTRRMEPISCWIHYSYKDNTKLKRVPKRSKTSKEVKSEYVNPNYREGLSYTLNYIEGTGYDNPALQTLNPYEEELKDKINTILHSLARSKEDHDWIDKGYLVYQRKQGKADIKYWGKEILATFGWSVNNDGTDHFDKINYSKNDHLKTPMFKLLDQLTPKEDNILKPERNEGESDESFNNRMKEYESKLKKHKEDNKKRHSDAINKDWINVIADAITEIGHYNAVEDNFELLHYGKNILDDYKTYVRKFGFFGDYKYDRHSSSEDSPDYIMERDNNVAAQYENYIRRLLLNQWKESNEKVTKWASRFQNLTSAQYMMMNIRGGIANVTLGQSQVAAEAHAKAIFNEKDWLKSEALYMSAIPSFATHMFDDKASSLIDAIIKAANVVDYDEKLGRARIVESPTSKGFNFFRKAMYSPQSIGEHYMQNRVLISALLSHHLYTEVDRLTGKETIVFKNRGEVIGDCAEKALLSMLNDTDKTRYNEFITAIKKDPNKTKEFAWFKEDVVNSFAKQFLKLKEKREYIKLREELEDKELKEFDNEELHPNVLSQLALSDDGYMKIADGSILSKYDITKEDGTPSDALTAFASLRNRVISVNKKIHGVYDKLGQAQVERKWFGSLVMQYHKHIPIGINKRYRKEGYYNEMRGTVERGSYVSLIQFLSTPFKKDKVKLELTDNEAEALTGIKNIFKSIIEFTTHVGLYWNMLPEYEKANIRRNLGDLNGVLIAMLLAVVLKGLGDDDDDSIPYNLALYEIDRLQSEAAQFTPPGAINEFKKLWSAPIAAQSGISDMWQSMDVICKCIFGGDEFDPYFRTGRFAGQHKLRVYIERRIPIWRGIKGTFIDITEQNTYYKLQQNVGGDIVNNLLDFVDNED